MRPSIREMQYTPQLFLCLEPWQVLQLECCQASLQRQDHLVGHLCLLRVGNCPAGSIQLLLVGVVLRLGHHSLCGLMLACSKGAKACQVVPVLSLSRTCLRCGLKTMQKRHHSWWYSEVKCFCLVEKLFESHDIRALCCSGKFGTQPLLMLLLHGEMLNTFLNFTHNPPRAFTC
mmetsp:Transcript_76630/g.248036  ORF Transcript_76630/g.248036 Transcript_76630/m.248036 type:complete len:174 (-) Transcript_76630:639-1160(-)